MINLNSKKTISKKPVYKVYKPHRSVSSYLKNSGMVFFVIIVGVGLATCVLLLNGLLKYTYGGDSSVRKASSVSSTFDQATMQKVSQLNASSQNTITDSTLGSKNPFTESN